MNVWRCEWCDDVGCCPPDVECMRKAMNVRPLTLKQANKMVTELHRHHKQVNGHRFSLGCYQDETLIGAVIVGRPVARHTEQYYTAEVSRLVTDGTYNACSFLYGAAARVAKEMGFDSIQTFILEEEPGTSLKASGWIEEEITVGGSWANREGRRTDQPLGPKVRWRKVLGTKKGLE